LLAKAKETKNGNEQSAMPPKVRRFWGHCIYVAFFIVFAARLFFLGKDNDRITAISLCIAGNIAAPMP
jgi:hypothetical protein